MPAIWTHHPRHARFDVVLSIVLVVLGISVGIAIWYTEFYAMFLVPTAAVLLSLIGAAFARRHRYLVVFCAIAAVNAWWLVVAGWRGLLKDQSQFIGLIQQ